MDKNELDKDIRNELKYRLVLARYSEDDPLTEAYMLEKLKDVYNKYRVKMSPKMQVHFTKEVEKIKNELTPLLEEKRKEYEKLTTEKHIVEKKKEKSIFTEKDIEKF